ncbi:MULTISPECIES: diacylglycerol kinase catalytic domain-containing protein [Kitasatospora]|uniref:Extensin-like C-terminal domain-containing protein n=1 Tax=Kitasatospora cystarginea TaxID=58350 RepID=A0ABP5R690_9ACTN
MRPSRRSILAGALGTVALAGGCGEHPTKSTGSSATTSAPAAGPATAPTGPAGASPSAPPALPQTSPWTPGAGEIQPDVKLRAVQLVEALGTWPDGGQGTVRAGSRIAPLGLDPALADQAGPLLGSVDRAALQVIVAQYGGILADSASVLVVCEQWTQTAAGPVVPGGTTVDVRLSAATPRWTVTALHPAAPGLPASALSPAAVQVLANRRIILPPAAVADIRSGSVHESVLTAMLTLAAAHTLAVSVVRSGHPLNVFGTDRPSDHPRGRAFDVWQIDGHAVVDPATPHALVDGFMRAAAAAGSYNVGGPRQLSGGSTPNQFFSDATHHDHVHIGFET